MKTRSKPLLQYLLQAGALHGSPEAIAAAKQNYRKEYRQAWRQKKRSKKEIRFELTIQQHRDIQLLAAGHGLKVATYVKSLALHSIGQRSAIDSQLLEILQLVSMAVIATSYNDNATRAHQLLLQAEALLLKHLKQ